MISSRTNLMIQIVEFFHHIEYLEREVPEFTGQIVRCSN